jgi:hypothetical protein
MAGRASFEHPIPHRLDHVAVIDVIERYVATVNARDMDGNRATMTAPHVRIGGDGEVIMLPDENALDRLTSFGSLEASGWQRTTLDWAEVIQADESKAHVALQFSRYREDDSHIVTFESLYVLVRRDGHWRIVGRSSFAPDRPATR